MQSLRAAWEDGMMNEYHLLYEKRYQKVYEAGAEYWGHTPDDDELSKMLTEWVKHNNLKGKGVIEFFCGEGAAGVILSKLGCVYHGVDISPSALQKAKDSLQSYSNALVTELNVVTGKIDGLYDAALDVMGFHMLVSDPDRRSYLRNAFNCLKNEAPMFFFRELCEENANDNPIQSFDEWLTVSKQDYKSSRDMNFKKDGEEIKIQLPYVPGRSKTKSGYIHELTEAGFVIDSTIDMELNGKCGESISIYVHKP